MDTRYYMVIIKGEIKTSEIMSCGYNRNTQKWDVKFNNGKTYSYAYLNVEKLTDPEVLNPNMYRISREGREFFDVNAIYVFRSGSESYWHICFGDGSERDYRRNDLHIIESCLNQSQSSNVFEYIKQIAGLSNLKNEETGEKLLSKKFDNENRELLGKDHIRGEQLPIDGYHLVVHVWIRNSKGQYLISQRSANKPTDSLMWECVGGSVVKGEDSLQGAIREAKEEVGVDLMPKNGQVLFTKTRKIIEGKIFNDIMDVWLFEYDGEVDLGNATTDEVTQVAWMNREQIKELFDANMFVDTLEYFFTEVDKK